MGRKRSAEPSLDPHGRVTLINLKGPESDRAYLDRITGKTGVPLATIVRRGIALWVARHGHEPAPPDWIEPGTEPASAPPAAASPPPPVAPAKPKPKAKRGRK